jgi:glycosyltransferase involved in cell wall biosynthesis
MTVATSISASSPPAAPKREIGRVIIATINRVEGDTGVHTHTHMLKDGLRNAGVACEVASPFNAGAKWLPIFAVRPLLLQRVNKTWSTLWHRRWHAAALRESLLNETCVRPPDVILAQCPVSAEVALQVRAETDGHFAVAMVCHFNRSEADEYRDKGELRGQRHFDAMLAFEQRVLESLDRVIYVSDWARRSVEGDRGIATRASSVIWNGLADANASSKLTRSDVGLAQGDLVLMNVGSLEPRKNQLGLIDLFAEIHAEHPSAKLVLVGDGPQRGEIERKVQQRKLSDAVKILGYRRDVPALLPLADVYIHFAALENCPLALIEAARAGLPFAAVPAGGVPELQSALECKIELQPHDHRQSLANLRPLLESAANRKSTGQRAREQFVATFTRPAMAQAYLKALAK